MRNPPKGRQRGVLPSKRLEVGGAYTRSAASSQTTSPLSHPFSAVPTDSKPGQPQSWHHPGERPPRAARTGCSGQCGVDSNLSPSTPLIPPTAVGIPCGLSLAASLDRFEYFMRQWLAVRHGFWVAVRCIALCGAASECGSDSSTWPRQQRIPTRATCHHALARSWRWGWRACYCWRACSCGRSEA